MTPRLRWSLGFSLLLHLLVLLAVLISLPPANLPEAANGTSFEVQFESVPKAPAKGPIARRSPTPSPRATQPQQPKPQPIAPDTAPPPPPPPAPPKAQAAQITPTPPKPIPTPPTPALTPTPTPVKVEQPKPAQNQALATSIPTPPEPVPVPPSPSTTSQPNQTKNPAPDSDSLLNTLAKLRSVTKDNAPPTAVANPESGGSTADSGNPNSDDTSKLTAAQIGAIGDAVRPCWTRDAGAFHADQLHVLLQVVTDQNGVVREAHVAPSDLDRVNSDPVLLAFSDRATNAVLDAKCATLPLPPSMLGQVHTFSFLFNP